MSHIRQRRKKVATCSFCGKPGHTAFRCGKRALERARRPPKEQTPIKMRKPLSPRGRLHKQWELTKRTWFKNHPPSHAGYYQCALQISPDCHRVMRRYHTTLDHIIPRSKRPDLSFTQSNLQPACWPCNELKGSKIIDVSV